MHNQPNYEFKPTTEPLNIIVSTPLTDMLRSLMCSGNTSSPKKEINKEDRIVVSREFHQYFGDLMRGEKIVDKDLGEKLAQGLKFCQSTVTTHLLYAIDMKGMNRPDVFEACIPHLIACKPGYTFFNTLVRGLVRQDAWKAITMLIRDDMSSKVNQFIFETLECHIKKRNRRCLRAMPRQGKVANRIRGYLKMRPAKWRHILAGGSRGSITSFMSNNDWGKIEYTKLSVYNLAMNYHAFMRHDRQRFYAFLQLYPDIAISMKKCRFSKHKPYPSSKEIFDNYIVPMKKEFKHEPARY